MILAIHASKSMIRFMQITEISFRNKAKRRSHGLGRLFHGLEQMFQAVEQIWNSALDSDEARLS